MKYILSSFSAGLSDYEDRGVRGSFKYGQNLNIRKNRDTLSCNQALTDETPPAEGFNTLIDWFVPASDGNIYGFSRNGRIYKRTSAGVWTLAYTDTNGAILGAWEWGQANNKTYLFWATATRLNAKEIPGASNWSDVNATITVGATNYTYPKTNLTSATNHMMRGIGGGVGALAINNNNTLALVGYDGSYTNEILRFTPGQEAKALLQRGNNLVMGTRAINQLYQSALFVWDGNDTEEVFGWDDTKPVPLGDIVGMVDTEVNLLVDAKGQVFNSNFISDLPIFTFPDGGKCSPGGVANEEYMALFGIWGNGSKTGIYSYGRKSKNAPMARNLEYALTATEIGAIIRFGDNLLVSYNNSGTYGVKNISASTKATAIYESIDLPVPTKMGFQERVTWESVVLDTAPLPSGASIACEYKMNKAGSYLAANTIDGSTTFTTTSGQEAVFLIGEIGRVCEIRLTLTPNGNNTPEIYQTDVHFS